MYRKAQKPTFNANGNASRQSDTSLEFFSEGIQKNQTKEDTILQLKVSNLRFVHHNSCSSIHPKIFL